MAAIQQKLDAYFKLWPKPTSKYVSDLVWAMNVAIQYLKTVKDKPSNKPKCVVFDFDDCLVFGDPAASVGVREMDLGEQDGNDIFILPRNEPICKIAEFAKSIGIQVIILTARPKSSREATVWNCKYLYKSIPYDAIVLNESNTDPCFKVNVRRRIALKYDILLTIGDQVTDCLCPGGNTAFIKLPDPGTYDSERKIFLGDESLASYAWIPPPS